MPSTISGILWTLKPTSNTCLLQASHLYQCQVQKIILEGWRHSKSCPPEGFKASKTYPFPATHSWHEEEHPRIWGAQGEAESQAWPIPADPESTFLTKPPGNLYPVHILRSIAPNHKATKYQNQRANSTCPNSTSCISPPRPDTWVLLLPEEVKWKSLSCV